MSIESFEIAFSDGVGSCRSMCACGKVFYNPDPFWEWEEGELEELINDPDAIQLDYSVGYVSFEGRTFVNACDCWHERAKQIKEFIDRHSVKIARYLNEEKKRKTIEARQSPTVDLL